MKARFGVAVAALMVLVLSLDARAAVAQAASAGTTLATSSNRAVLDRYCISCHNQRVLAGGLRLDTVDLERVSGSAATLEKIVRKLRSGTMPPVGAPHLEPATAAALMASLERALDEQAAANPYPGRPLLHRLNRTEYRNAIRDLLDLDVDVASLLPPDDSAYGFDNVSDVLGVSPVLLERYLSAADRISALAIGDPLAGPGSETFRVRHDLSQDQHIDGLPLGTVGGMMVHPTLALEGDYDFQIKLFRSNLESIRGLEYPHEIEITVDGARIFLATIGGDADFAGAVENPTSGGDAVEARLHVRAHLKAGPREIGVAFIRQIGEGTRRLQPFLRSSADTFDSTGLPHVEKLTIAGPFNIAAAADTPSRRRIFSCRPAASRPDDACARQIVTTLTRRAYRRPVSDDDLRPLMNFYQLGRRKHGFEAGVQMAVRRLLASPAFVFRAENDPETLPPGTVYRISDLELASRLSFFLWSSIPDDELLVIASQGRLTDAAVLEKQVRRMLRDPRASSLVTNFAGQWLQLRNLQRVVPNSGEFPDFDDNLRQSFAQETELFFESVMREDRNVLELMTANYTFVNERLAKHYGIPGVYGSQLRRVTLTDEARRGLLGKGSVLLVTSHADRTSPVVRGKWILDNILGMPPPPPPPDVPPLKETEEGQRPRTMREQMTEHRSNAICASCHKVMDPIGFAMENFDAVGKWRAVEAGVPIDASGQLADGAKVDGIVGLRQALLQRPEIFVGTLTEKLMTYGLGRGLDYHDMPAVRRVVSEASHHDYQFSSLVLGIVTSTPFRMRVVAPDRVDSALASGGEGAATKTAVRPAGEE